MKFFNALFPENRSYHFLHIPPRNPTTWPPPSVYLVTPDTVPPILKNQGITAPTRTTPKKETWSFSFSVSQIWKKNNSGTIFQKSVLYFLKFYNPTGNRRKSIVKRSAFLRFRGLGKYPQQGKIRLCLDKDIACQRYTPFSIWQITFSFCRVRVLRFCRIS